MKTIEAEKLNEVAVMRCPATDTEAPKANYEPVRYNAMKHGILSRLAVLPHEDGGEFADLLAALIEEHKPAGMTERHLLRNWRQSSGVSGGCCWPRGQRSIKA